MMKYLHQTLLIFAVLLSACSPVKHISYFESLDKDSSYLLLSEEVLNYQSTITYDDQMSITVGAMDPNSVLIFNMPFSSYAVPGETVMSVSPQQQIYTVDAQGNIDFPVLGKIKVVGLTRLQLSELIKGKVAKYVTDPIVTITMQNFKVTIIGEVAKPGPIQVVSDRISILDALGKAGDLTIYGNRTNVLLIREADGKRESYRYDLTKSDLFTSPYYYLRQNDVIYVEPNKARKGTAKYNQDSQFKLSVISTLTSALSVIVSMTIALISINK